MDPSIASNFFFSTSTSQVLEQHDSSELLSSVQTFKKILHWFAVLLIPNVSKGAAKL